MQKCVKLGREQSNLKFEKALRNFILRLENVKIVSVVKNLNWMNVKRALRTALRKFCCKALNKNINIHLSKNNETSRSIANIKILK